MVQEVQQQGNRYQTPNRIEGVGHSERKMSDHTQIRDHETNSLSFSSNGVFIQKGYADLEHPTSWSFTTSNDMYCKVDGGDIYVSLAGPYLVEYTPVSGWESTDKYRIRMYSDGQLVFEDSLTVKDQSKRTFTANLGRRNKLTFDLIPIDLCGVNVGIKLRFIKL